MAAAFNQSRLLTVGLSVSPPIWSEIPQQLFDGLPWNVVDIHCAQSMNANDFGDLPSSIAMKLKYVVLTKYLNYTTKMRYQI